MLEPADAYVRSMPHTELARLTQIDYDREMAFVAVQPRPGGGSETIGVIRTVADPDNEVAELAVVVRTDLKRLGLGTRLMAKSVAWCRGRGLRALEGDVLAGNESMLALARSFKGWTFSEPDEDGCVRIRYALREQPIGVDVRLRG